MIKCGDKVVVVAVEEDERFYKVGDVFTIDAVFDDNGEPADTVYEAEGGKYEFYAWEIAPFEESIEEAKDMTKEEFNEAVRGSTPDGDLSAPDLVQRPNHYAQGKMETIEIIAEVIRDYEDPFVGHTVGTAVKYLSRAPHKHDTPIEDLRKARRYLDFAIERLEGKR